MNYTVLLTAIVAICCITTASAAIVEQTDKKTLELTELNSGDRISCTITGVMPAMDLVLWEGRGISTTEPITDVTIFYDLSELRTGSLLVSNSWAGYGTSWGRNGESVDILEIGDIDKNDECTVIIVGIPYGDQIEYFIQIAGYIETDNDCTITLPEFPAKGEITLEMFINGSCAITTARNDGSVWEACSFYESDKTYRTYTVGSPSPASNKPSINDYISQYSRLEKIRSRG
ncbi:MAG: hypothetical protein WC489_06380 [Patescibacteria group bacterium]|jgi:hypothetical protein